MDAGNNLADLRVEVTQYGADCPDRTVELEVFNDGAVAVDSTTVRVYAGDPAAGGEVLLDAVPVGTVPAGGSLGGIDLSVPLPTRSLTLFFVVDPDGAVDECDDSNNSVTRPAACILI